ncbi:hypothetical protein [uncultured Olleya sp.]|uniref:hypothetical protein n=1 Tax=uncultured Olleya sp. TaxID=757243 RepID=UPI0025934304|nr:hypothetical protein [uncultured Olleya sp.]
MIAQDKTTHEDILQQSINHLEFLGFENIKADLIGYEQPKTFIKKENNLVMTPDITAYKRTKKYYFELGLKSEKPKLLKSKWRLLDVFTRMKDHKFKIISTKGHYSFANTIIKELNLDKTLIKL